jgi:PAS domain S-box-containing protein
MIKFNKLKQFFNRHTYTQEEQFLKEKITLLNVVLVLMATNVFFFAIYRYMSENYLQSFIDILFSSSLLLGFVFLAKDKNNFLYVSRFLIFFAMLVVFKVIVDFPTVDTRFSWLTLIVYLIFYLLDMREAKVWFSGLMFTLFGLYAVGIVDMTLSELIVFTLTTLFLALFLVQYEAIKLKSQKLFLNHNRELKESVEQKVTELKEQQDIFEHLFLKSSDGTLLIEDEKLIKCNNSLVEIFGYSDDAEILSLDLNDLSPEFQLENVTSKERSEKILKSCIFDGTCNFEWISKKANGELFWCDITVIHLKINSRDIIHAVFRDISDKKALEAENKKIHENLENEVTKRTEELEIALKAKDQFLANMSHEIRTPLNAIVGFIDILTKNEQDSSKLKYLNIIQTSGQSLLEIIKDILDFSKIESSNIELETQPFLAKKPFEDIYQLFSHKAQTKGITLLLDSSTLPLELLGDELRVKQVVSNLLSNALKFTPKGGKVSIKVAYNHENQELECSVKDTGIGIKEESLEKIFDSFSQADNSTTREYGGTGLGLSISKNIVELMGGKLLVKSRVGEGTTFSFTLKLPVVKSREENTKEREKSLISFDEESKILVVEDNVTNQILIEMLLEDLNLSCEIVANGLEALNRAQESEYDLILMDENMPVMNGMESTKKIRELGYKKPIVAVTANALKGDRERFLESGMDEYISKPIDIERFTNVLKKYLKIKS